MIEICRPLHPSASLYEIVPLALVLPSMMAAFALSPATMAYKPLTSTATTDDASVSMAMA